MLTHEQLAVVYDTSPHRKVIAGAGTGKTHVLVADIQDKVARGLIDPATTVAITFTRRAGQELQTRLDAKKIRLAYVGTSYALCYSLLYRWGERRTLIDEEDLSEIAVMISERCRLGNPSVSTLVKDFIERHKMRPKAIPAIRRAIVRQMDAYLTQHRLILIGEMPQLVISMCETQPRFRELLRTQVRHVYWDEYQDTEPAEADLLKRINPKTTFLIGDPRQAIYGWRGASADYLMKHVGSGHHLTINWRSEPSIVALANRLQPAWPPLAPAKMTDNGHYVNSLQIPHISRHEGVGKLDDTWIDAIRRMPRPVHVICRSNREVAACAASLASVAEVRAFGRAFDSYASPEWRAVFNFCRAVLMPECEWALHAVSKLASLSDQVVDPQECVREVRVFLDPASIDSPDPVDAMSLVDFVSWYARRDIQDSMSPAAVTISTAHAVKGLEFDHVILSSFGNPGGFRCDTEEARCLTYVAATRARDRLMILDTGDVHADDD